MPRGIYDRSKAAKKPTKTAAAKSAKPTKTAQAVKTAKPSSPSTVVEVLQNITRCADIINLLNGTTGPVAEHAKNGMLGLLNSFIDQASPSKPSEEKTIPNVKTAQPGWSADIGNHKKTEQPAKEATAGQVYPPLATSTIKLKKDGTPKQRPGPKKKDASAEIMATQATPPNGNSDVFNPEHAS